MRLLKGSDGNDCGDETASDMADDCSLGPRGTAAALKALGALASSHRRELESLFTEYLKQQRLIFEVVASSNSWEHSAVHALEGMQSPSVELPHQMPDANTAMAEARQVAMTPADRSLPPDSPDFSMQPIVGEASRKTVAWKSESDVDKIDEMDLCNKQRNSADDLSFLRPHSNGSLETAALPRTLVCLRKCCELKPEEQQRTVMQRFVDHMMFKYFISVIILVNTVMLGLMSQDRVKAIIVDQPPEAAWDSIELAFFVIFAVEIVLRLVAEGRAFFVGHDWRWNLFDTLIVIHSLIDQVASFAPNLSFARSMRIVRFLRIMRLVRVLRVFTSFRLMVYSLLGSVLPLLWIFLWLSLILYSFSIFFLHGVAESYTEVDTITQEDMRAYYGSVFRSMLSLFMCVSGGDDWSNRLRPFWFSDLYLYVFILYIFVMVFGAVNVVVAAFVETAAEISRRDRDSIIEKRIAQTQQVAEDIRTFFVYADKNSSGNLDREELSEYLSDDRVKASFSSLDLDVSQAIDLFDLLDADEDGSISLDEFVSGCMRLRGTASSMDINLLLWEVEKLTWKVTSANRQINRCFSWLEKLLGSPAENDSEMPTQNPRKKRLEAWTPDKKPAMFVIKTKSRRPSVQSVKAGGVSSTTSPKTL